MFEKTYKTKEEMLRDAIIALDQGDIDLSNKIMQELKQFKKKLMVSKYPSFKPMNGVIPLTKNEMLRNSINALQSGDAELAMKFMELVKFQNSKEKK
jgi:phosphate uptake regulator